MRKTYQVAGHKFCVEMPDGHPAWEAMHLNYDPFQVEEDGDCIYHAEMIDKLPDDLEKRVVLLGEGKKGFPRFDLFETSNGWLMAVSSDIDEPVTFYILTNKTYSEARFVILGLPDFSINRILMLMFAFATARRNTLLLHASVTMHQDKGYLFLGKSGTGKSTHSQLWINNIEGCELLNDDNPAIHVEDNGEVRVYGTPWSGKTPCYRNLDVPVGAIVDLHQAPRNEICRLKLLQAYAALYISFSGCRFIKEMANDQHATIEKVVLSVPCFSLNCLPNAEAAWLCHKTVAQ